MTFAPIPSDGPLAGARLWHDPAHGTSITPEGRTPCVESRPRTHFRQLETRDLEIATRLLSDTVHGSQLQKAESYLPHRRADDDRPRVGLVAEEDEVVGVAAGAGVKLSLNGLAVSPDEITRRIVLLDFLAVAPSHRRRGVGSLLHNAFLNEFAGSGHRLVFAHIAAARTDLLPIYRRWGWTIRARGAGIAVQIGAEPVVLGEDPATRVAWRALDPGIGSAFHTGAAEPVLTGVFA